jgi:hypothetical protein
MHEENPAIDDLNYSKRTDESAVSVREQIRLSSVHFGRLAAEHKTFEFKKLRSRTPNFALTLTDNTALIVQYLHSLNWGLGPHLQCGASSPMYRILKKEFESLWASAESSAS